MKTITKHEITDAWKWFQQAWEETEGARMDFFAVGLISFAVTAVVSRIPLLGGLVASFLFPLFHYGAFVFAAQWKLKKERQISLLFVGFQQPALKMFLPLCYVSVGFGAVSSLFSMASMGGFGLMMAGGVIAILVHAVQGAVLYFAPPLVALDGMTPQEAMQLSVRAVIDNLPTFVVAALIGFLLFLVGCATLGIGLIFLLPVYTYLPYHVFGSVFREEK